MKKISYIMTLLAVSPFVAFAAVTDFKSLMQLFADLLGAVMGVLYMAAFAAFFWGIVLFIFNTDDDYKRQEGKNWMFWSIIALFVMITVWGLVGLLLKTVGINAIIIPQL